MSYASSSYGQQPRIYPDAVVLEVYEGSSDKRGMVRVNYMGQISPLVDDDGNQSRLDEKFNVDAWLLMPYGFKPSTKEAQASVSRLETPLNQAYGITAAPRRGDRVIVLHSGPDKWYVIGAVGASGGNEPPVSDPNELSFIHRSGASIRMNENYPGVSGGDGEYDGINGNMVIVANRNTILAGSRWLPHGLLAAHLSTGTKIELNDGVDDGHSYASIFANTDPGATNYYEPWASSLGSDKFLRPPDTIPDNTFYLLHQAGGLVKIDPLNNYSGMKISAAGLTIAVGEGFWDAGLRNVDDHTSHHPNAPNSAPVKDTFRIIHPSGAYYEIGTNGEITMATAEGQQFKVTSTGAGNIVIEAPGGGKVLLGGASAAYNVISDNDSTDTIILKDSIFQLPILDMSMVPQHGHGLTALQDDVKVV